VPDQGQELGLIISFWAVAAGIAELTMQRTPINRLEFVTGRVAGMTRMIDGHYTCVAIVNGQAGERGDIGICHVMGAAGAHEIVERAGPEAQFEAVLSIGVDGAAPPPLPADMGLAIGTSSARMTVRPDGSIATCIEGPGRVLHEVPGLHELVPLCETYPAGPEPVFTDAPTGVATRAAQVRVDYFLRRP
jgi:DNA-binding FrmR family transcriptional regulator